MVDRIVFDKIQEYIKQIDSNNDSKITQEELKKQKGKVPSLWLENITKLANGKDISTDKVIMGLGVEHIEEQDPEHTPDIESDGKYRFKSGTDNENYQRALQETKFFIRRNVNKWFSKDLNADGYLSETEDAYWTQKNQNSNFKDGDLTEKEYAVKYGTSIKPGKENYSQWIKDWREYVIYTTAYNYGIELSEKDLAELEQEAKIQINKWLVKSGEGETKALYNRLGNDAYTRLITSEQTVSCCGGNITPPPMAPNKNSCAMCFSNISSSDDTNSAKEMKNRLAWAIYSTPELGNHNEDGMTIWSNLSDFEYSMYHNEYTKIRSMKAADFRNLLKPENQKQREEFEQHSNMSVRQIVDYINIVENVTGHNFDDDNWEVNGKQFFEINNIINGTTNEDNLLDGKTAKDIPPERRALYNYLKTHTDSQGNSMLLPQFKDE